MERTASARAMDFSSLYYINREKFLSLLDMFPEDKVSRVNVFFFIKE